MTRKDIHSFLEQAPNIQVVGEAQDEDEIKSLVARLRPQILRLDMVMPKLLPAELEKWVRSNYPETITLVLTAHDRDAYLSTMMDAGAAGYLDKKLHATELIAAIRRAAQGNFLFDKEQIERARRWREDITRKWGSLSNREQQVLQLLTEGANNRTIAASLGIARNTLEKHLENVYRKLNVGSRAEVTYWWIEKNT